MLSLAPIFGPIIFIKEQLYKTPEILSAFGFGVVCVCPHLVTLSKREAPPKTNNNVIILEPPKNKTKTQFCHKGLNTSKYCTWCEDDPQRGEAGGQCAVMPPSCTEGVLPWISRTERGAWGEQVWMKADYYSWTQTLVMMAADEVRCFFFLSLSLSLSAMSAVTAD